jgi:hypothetical protein
MRYGAVPLDWQAKPEHGGIEQSPCTTRAIVAVFLNGFDSSRSMMVQGEDALPVVLLRSCYAIHVRPPQNNNSAIGGAGVAFYGAGALAG